MFNIHEYECTCLDSLLIITVCKHIHLVIEDINSLLNRIPVESSNVFMKSVHIWNKEISIKS